MLSEAPLFKFTATITWAFSKCSPFSLCAINSLTVWPNVQDRCFVAMWRRSQQRTYLRSSSLLANSSCTCVDDFEPQISVVQLVWILPTSTALDKLSLHVPYYILLYFGVVSSAAPEEDIVSAIFWPCPHKKSPFHGNTLCKMTHMAPLIF